MMAPNATVEFASGMPGFETCRRFVVVQSADLAPGVCLKGLDAPAPLFFTVDPRRLAPDYPCVLSSVDAARLGAAHGGECVWLALVAWGDGAPLVNLRAPLVINPRTMRGIQVLPSESAWAVDAPWPMEAACSS